MFQCQASVPPLYQKEAIFRYQMVPQIGIKLMETTTQHYIKTTEKPCTSTIKIQVEESHKAMEPWSLTSKQTGKTGH